MSDYGTFKSFSTNTGTSGTTGTAAFLESNSLVAKFAFLLLVIFAFVILLRVGISAVSYMMKPAESPHLIDGMVDAKQMLIFHQDPSNNDAVTIYRSVNENNGIEFSWSVWIYINDLQYLNNQYKHIFHKGNSDLAENGLNFPNNAPGLYLAPVTNSLVVMMNTFSTITEEIVIPDIPLHKWLNIIIRCKNTTFDVYANGTIVRSINLMGLPKQNYGDVFVAMNGGFDGDISNLWYFNYALGTSEIQKIVSNGPNTKLIGNTGMSDRNTDYLSLRWFFYGSGVMFNPGAMPDLGGGGSGGMGGGSSGGMGGGSSGMGGGSSGMGGGGSGMGGGGSGMGSSGSGMGGGGSSMSGGGSGMGSSGSGMGSSMGSSGSGMGSSMGGGGSGMGSSGMGGGKR